ncbi:MAG: hypothetical protein AB1505_36550, partial [Candidatus Latescibacterota bacterium]
GRTQAFEVQALRLGNLALLGLEGEVFARYQLELEADSPLQPTVLVGYANGCVGYVPTADEYRRGGYEVGEAGRRRPGRGTWAYQVYPSVQMLAPGSEAAIRAGARRLLAELSLPGAAPADP